MTANPQETGGSVPAEQRGDSRVLRYDASAVFMLEPVLGPLTYLGFRPFGRRIPVYKYYDQSGLDISYGLVVSTRRSRDWRGGRRTYEGHPGVDFVVPVGTPVVAAAPGVVRSVGDDPLGGTFVWIDHGGGYGSDYHHLSKALVETGQSVARGQRIARSGATGWILTGTRPWIPPHLHFGLTVNGLPLDPYTGPTPWGKAGFWRDPDRPLPFASGVEPGPDLPMSLRPKDEVFAADADVAPILFGNYGNVMAFLAPAAISFSPEPLDLRVQLTLPFEASQFDEVIV